MASTSFQPPFAWIGRITPPIAVAIVVVAAAFLRFWQLNSLPPGLYETGAQIGLEALRLLEHGTLPGLTAANGYAPLWVWLQAGPIALLGHTELALRLLPALFGTLAVYTTWLWTRLWFGPRVGWLAAFLLAVSPWAITLSRNGIEAGAYPLLVTLTLWLATRAWLHRTVASHLALAAVLAADLLTGPIGWLIVAVTLSLGLVQLIRTHQLTTVSRARMMGLAGLAAGLAGLGYLIGTSLGSLKNLPAVAQLTSSIATLGSNLVKTLLMFNVRGDENYRHNLSGTPMLNAFVGLMFIAGIIVSVGRLHHRAYRLLLVLFIAFLFPAVITTVGVPNAARAVAVLPIVITIAAIGVSYMLELWYATFPINSAARSVGQAAIIVLLALTAFQGYTQYFRAWAGSSQVYTAYNEGVVQIAHRLTTDKFTGTRYIVAAPSEQAVIDYLNHQKTAYTPIAASDIAALPVGAGSRQFMIATDSRAEASKTLKVKFPGGVLRPHYSAFNQSEIYYSYEVVTK